MPTTLEEKLSKLTTFLDLDSEFDPGFFNIFFHNESLKSDYANFIKLYETYKEHYENSSYGLGEFWWNKYFEELEEKCSEWYEIILSEFDSIEDCQKTIKFLFINFVEVELNLQDLIIFYKQAKQY